MRFLVDEMFHPDVAARPRAAGHDAVAAGLTVPAVIIALKRTLPRGAGVMSHHLAERLDGWAQANPDPYRHVHWLGPGS